MNKIKIGIVEDEGITVEIILRALRQLNYALTEPASNYDQAIKMVEAERPDLLLIDIKLEKERMELSLRMLSKRITIFRLFLLPQIVMCQQFPEQKQLFLWGFW